MVLFFCVSLKWDLALLFSVFVICWTLYATSKLQHESSCKNVYFFLIFASFHKFFGIVAKTLEYKAYVSGSVPLGNLVCYLIMQLIVLIDSVLLTPFRFMKELYCAPTLQ